MSMKLYRAAREVRGLSMSERLTLYCLADHAHDNGVCWVGLDGICDEQEISRTVVYSALRVLKGRGLVEQDWTPGRKGPCLRLASPESGIRNPESGIRNPEIEASSPESGLICPESGFAYKGIRTPIEPLLNPQSPPAREDLPQDRPGVRQISTALQGLRDTWPEFKRRAFEGLGIDQRLAAQLEVQMLFLPKDAHQTLVTEWINLCPPSTVEDLLVLADWIAAGHLAGIKHDRPSWLVRRLAQSLSDARLWHERGRPDARAQGKGQTKPQRNASGRSFSGTDFPELKPPPGGYKTVDAKNLFDPEPKP